jgi:excinuclease UvrABC nuclease subunit
MVTSGDSRELLAELQREMLEAADRLEFERAAYLRDQIKELERKAKGRK